MRKEQTSHKNEHNTLMCFPLEPVFIRDGEGVPNFMDEPTAGLDVEGRLSLHEQIRQLKAAGKTIILTSHDMAEVENLCDRIAILSGGRIAFIGTVEQLGETVGKHYNITIQTETGTGKYESDNIGETLLTLLVQCREKGETILDIQIGRGSLEQHFMKIAKGV